MSQLLARLLLAILVIAGTPVVYCIVCLAIWAAGLLSGDSVLVAADVVTGALLCTCWIGVWRNHVHWTSRRRRLTALAVLGAVVVGVAIGLIIIATVAFGFESGIVLGGATWAICWLALTVWIWRETPAERVRRLNALTGGALPCPTCGYNLTGLQQARCPECGTQYTLDELYAAMGPPQVELEKR